MKDFFGPRDYPTGPKDRWHSATRAKLVRIAKQLGIPTNERRISSNKAGPAVGGEVTMSAPSYGAFVSLSCPINAYGEANPCGAHYARGCDHQDPYGGGLRFPNWPLRAVEEGAIIATLTMLHAKYGPASRVIVKHIGDAK